MEVLVVVVTLVECTHQIIIVATCLVDLMSVGVHIHHFTQAVIWVAAVVATMEAVVLVHITKIWRYIAFVEQIWHHRMLV
jgi:membrane protein YdbS with pleckstrin-like domain